MALRDLTDLDQSAGGGQNKTNSFIEWLKDKGSEFVSHYTANSNPYSYSGTNAVYDELGLGHREADESALENNYNQAKSGTTFNDLLEQFNNGEINATQFQELVASKGIKLTGSQQDWLSTQLSQQMTQEEYDRGIQSIGDSAKATQEAAIATGMNPTAYMMANGAGTNPGVSKAEGTMSSSKAERLARFERNTQMAKTMIGIAGSMASTGIYGTALYAAKTAASRFALAASKYSTDQRYKHMKSTYFDRKNGFINQWYD